MILPSGPVKRPDPPEILTSAQAKVWRMTVEAMPAGWFRPDTEPVLVAYCRAVSDADTIEALIAGFDPQAAADSPEGLKALKDLMAMRATNCGIVATLATKMRLTPQSRYDAQKAATATKHESAGTKLWQRSAAGA